MQTFKQFLTETTYTCDKCGGSGVLHSFKHIEDGKCFKCGGTGTLQYDPSKKAGRRTLPFSNRYSAWFVCKDKNAMSAVMKKLNTYRNLKDPETHRVEIEYYSKTPRSEALLDYRPPPQPSEICFEVYPIDGEDLAHQIIHALGHGNAAYEGSDYELYLWQFSGTPTPGIKFHHFQY